MKILTTTNEEASRPEDKTTDLAGFFDLLAKFDVEDSKKPVIDDSSLDSASRDISSVTDRNNLDKNPAVRTSGKTCSAKPILLKDSSLQAIFNRQSQKNI